MLAVRRDIQIVASNCHLIRCLASSCVQHIEHKGYRLASGHHFMSLRRLPRNISLVCHRLGRPHQLAASCRTPIAVLAAQRFYSASSAICNSSLPHKMSFPRTHNCSKSKVLVFGAGNFGSCLADHLADSQHEVFVWSRSENVVKSLNETHRNPEYLKDHTFPDTLKAVGPGFPSPEVIQNMDVLLFAIPTEGVRQALVLLFK